MQNLILDLLCDLIQLQRRQRAVQKNGIMLGVVPRKDPGIQKNERDQCVDDDIVCARAAERNASPMKWFSKMDMARPERVWLEMKMVQQLSMASLRRDGRVGKYANESA